MKLTKREAVAMQKGLMDILSPLLGNNIFLFEELMEQGAGQWKITESKTSRA